jgi:DNA invertase Pin-like site-specific DNA recombinase
MAKAVRAVTMIPPTINPLTRQAIVATVKRRVAGYARVSTDSDEQFTSYEAQIDYYTQYITSHADWEFVKVYTDEGISGLNTKHREGFNEMIRDALDGKIDLIVTKSVSRFARNTVDSLTTIRKLKDAGCECYFEKENIWTFDGKGELLLTIMSSLAQEESRSISENVTWGQRKRFADGKVSMPYKQFLGYEKGPDGLPKIVPEQAETVRYIYDLFMSGKTITAIAKQLTAEGIPTPGGKEKWVGRTVESILTNEKYKGDARLQKKFTVDFLQKKMKVNEGEVPQYYVENSHEAIIDPLLFDRVQEEMARRKALGRSYSGKTIFSCRLICGDCGHYLGSKVWNSTNKYRRVIWQCNNKFKGECKCGTPHLTEEFIKAKFLEAYNQLLPDRERLIEDCRVIQAALTDCTDIDREMQQLLEELEVVAELTKRCVDENSSTALDQGDYLARYNGLVERYEKAQERVKELERKRTERMAKADAIGGFMFRLREMDQPMDHFDERLWLDVIDRVVVHRDGLTFKFQNGKEIRV